MKGSDRYIVEREIGTGGMGVVYEAVDRERGASVALKTLKKMDAGAIARFKNEFRLLSDIAHPNLVSLYELVVSEDRLFFTMELVRGVDFVRWVRRSGSRSESPPAQEDIADVSTPDVPAIADDASSEPGERTVLSKLAGPNDVARRARREAPARPARGRNESNALDPRRLRDALRQLAEGVAAIHDKGLLHRDIKPSNVLVTPEGRVVLLDFGVSTELRQEMLRDGESRHLVGTPNYMSPEQGARQVLTPASDWYAVGAMLYVALTGRMPFVGGQDDVLMDKQQFEPPPPSQIATGVPDDLNALCVALMRRNPDRRPSGNDVLRRLGSDARPRLATMAVGTHTSTGGGSRGTIVGREAQLSSLHRCLAAAGRGTPVVALVSGRSGMGKSTLVRQFTDDVEGKNETVVLSGRCFERESVPFKGFDSLVDALSRYLARLSPVEAEGVVPRDAMALVRVFPVLRQVTAFRSERRRPVRTRDPQEIRRRAFSALRELLARLADRSPLVLCIDDVQWADTDSAALLADLVRPPDAPAVLVVAGYRAEDAQTSEFLAVFRDQVEAGVDLRPIELAPLSPEEARELALVHLHGSPRAVTDADRIAAESGGSPLFVEELARHVRDEIRPHDRDFSLEDVLRGRLRRVPAEAARLLETIAVAGRPIAQTLAFQAAEVNDPALLSVLRAGSFVRTRSAHGERYVEPYHDRVRETVVSDMAADALRRCHGRLAFTLERSPNADPEVLAVYFDGAGDRASAANYANIAAQRASQTLAFDRAARLYANAIELDETGDPAALRSLYAAMGEALVHAGRGVDAAEAFIAAGVGAPTSDRLEMQRRASLHFLRAGHVERGLDTLDEVMESAGLRLPRTPRGAVFSLLKTRARLALRGLDFKEREESEIPARVLRDLDTTFTVAEGIGMVDPVMGAYLQALHLLKALRAGEPGRAIRALGGELAFVAVGGSRTEKKANRILERLKAIASQRDDPMLSAIAIGVEGIALYQRGRFLDANPLFEQAERILREHCHGSTWELSIVRMFYIITQQFLGNLETMKRVYNQTLREARGRGDLFAEVTMRCTSGYFMYCLEDEPTRGHEDLDDALARWTDHTYSFQHAMAYFSHVMLDLYENAAERAWERTVKEWPRVTRSLILNAQALRAALRHCRGRAALALARERGDAALLRIARREGQRLIREPVPYATGWGHTLLGAVERVSGDDHRALAHLGHAHRDFAGHGHTMWDAAVRYIAAHVRGGGDGDRVAADVEAEIRAAGVPDPLRLCRVVGPGYLP